MRPVDPRTKTNPDVFLKHLDGTRTEFHRLMMSSPTWALALIRENIPDFFGAPMPRKERVSPDDVELCYICEAPLSPKHIERDHFPIPQRHGGTLTVPMCVPCHTVKDRGHEMFFVDLFLAARRLWPQLDRLERIYLLKLASMAQDVVHERRTLRGEPPLPRRSKRPTRLVDRDLVNVDQVLRDHYRNDRGDTSSEPVPDVRPAKARARRTPAPFGYQIEHGQIVPYDREQEILHLARDFRRQGQTYQEIAQSLNVAGYQTRSQTPFTISSVYSMLKRGTRNRSVAGAIRAGKGGAEEPPGGGARGESPDVGDSNL